MGNLFGSKKKKEEKPKQQYQAKSEYQPKQQTQKQPQTQSAYPQKKELTQGEIQRMKLQHSRDQLRDKKKQIESQIETYETEIRDLISKNRRDQAKYIVQRKMLYDKFLENILQKEQVIAQAIITVDQIQSDAEMANIVNQTSQVVKDIQSSIDMQKLEDNFLDLQEMKQRQQEMNGMFKQYQVDDEAEVDAIYSKYAGADFEPKVEAKFVPLQQQPQQKQQEQHQQQQQQQQQQIQQEDDEYKDKLAMLE